MVRHVQRIPTVQTFTVPEEEEVPIIGEVRRFAFTPPPALWLPCDGAAKSRATYAALFAAIGTTYGPGDEVTTFNVPESRGRVSAGAGAGPGLTVRALGQLIGEEAHTLLTPELPSHNHPVGDPGHTHNVPIAADQIVFTPGNVAVQTSGNTDYSFVADADGAVTGVSVGNTGDGNAHNTMQPTAVFQDAIYAGA